MIIINNVTLIGRLTKDPELRYIPGSGTAVAKFSIAVDKGLSKQQKEECEANNKPTADFINIVVWSKAAENCANFLSKGKLVGIQGRIQSGSYDKEGTRVYTTDVVASNVEFLEKMDKSNATPEGFHEVSNQEMPWDAR